MQVRNPSMGSTGQGPSVRDRILGEIEGCRDEALIFAASSIINEISSPQYAGQTVERTVRTDAGQYTLRGNRVHGAEGVAVVLVFAEPGAPWTQSSQGREEKPLLRRLGLTRKEARVAQLLAVDHSNQEIAAALCISAHTARHHTQSVLNKLGIRSRHEVAAALGQDH